jgi:hypothetical protein
LGTTPIQRAPPSTSSKSSSSTTKPNADLYALDAFTSAPWNRCSFFFGLLHGYLKIPEDFLETLHACLHISDTESFLEFFEAKPSSFLMRFPMQSLQAYHDQLYQAWSIARFCTTSLHATESLESFALHYDEPYSLRNSHHCKVIDGISRLVKQSYLLHQADFQNAFDTALRTSERTAPLFREFNSRLGRHVPTTPTPPVRTTSSPLVEPRYMSNPFSNLSPYAGVGPTHESQSCSPPHCSFPTQNHVLSYCGSGCRR